MKSTVAVALSLLIVLAALPAAAFAQSDARGSRASSQRARVREMASGTEYQGDVYDSSDDVGATVREESDGSRAFGVVQRVPRQNHQSVVPARKSHHVGRWIAIGAAAFGAVMLIWFIHYANCGCG